MLGYAATGGKVTIEQEGSTNIDRDHIHLLVTLYVHDCITENRCLFSYMYESLALKDRTRLL